MGIANQVQLKSLILWYNHMQSCMRNVKQDFKIKQTPSFDKNKSQKWHIREINYSPVTKLGFSHWPNQLLLR